jgi:hypothetical protein
VHGLRTLLCTCSVHEQRPCETRNGGAEDTGVPTPSLVPRRASERTVVKGPRVVEPPTKWRLYQPCLYLRCCAGAICAVGWMDLMIILQLLLCLTRCEQR